MDATSIFESLIYIAAGAAVALPVILLNLRYAAKLKLIDWPKARGVSQEQVPIIGYGLVVTSIVGLASLSVSGMFSPWIVVTSAILALMGHLDDRHPLPPIEKLILQILCVVSVVLFDQNIQAAIGDRYGIWGDVLAIVFIVGLVNAINFIDGIDGLAGTVLLIGGLGCVLFSQGVTTHYSYFVMACFVVGMMLPFIHFNISKKKGFLGNIGSYFFGYLLAVMHVSIPLKTVDPFASISLSALCFLVPIADSVTVVSTRLLSVRSPFQGDKGHLHHRLVQTALPLRFVLLNFALIGVAGVAIAYFFNIKSAMQHSRLPFIICLAYVGIISLLIGMIEKASRKRLQSYFLRFDSEQPVFFLKYRLRTSTGGAPSPVLLKRLEAKISTEIRVYDACFVKAPDELFVVLNSLEEPIQSIADRIQPILEAEKLQATLIADKGEYLKLSYQKPAQMPKIRPAAHA